MVLPAEGETSHPITRFLRGYAFFYATRPSPPGNRVGGMNWVSVRIPSALQQPEQNEQNNKTASIKEPNLCWGFLRRRRRGVLNRTNPNIKVIKPAR